MRCPMWNRRSSNVESTPRANVSVAADGSTGFRITPSGRPENVWNQRPRPFQPPVYTPGVGRRLLEAFMDAGRSAGASKMFLTSGESVMPSRRLSEALGGEVTAQGPTMNYWFLLQS